MVDGEPCLRGTRRGDCIIMCTSREDGSDMNVLNNHLHDILYFTFFRVPIRHLI